MKMFAFLVGTAVAGAAAQDIPERDFACGGEIEYFCGESKDPRDCLKEHRHELGATCLAALIEHESLHCG